MDHAGLLARLLPPVTYDATQPRIAAGIAAEGKVLDAAQADGLATLDAITPGGDLSMLSSWERVLDLPESSLGTNQSEALRLQMVLARLNETGELHREHYIVVALELGFSMSVTEFNAFRVGSPVEQPLYGDDWMFVWQINVQQVTDGVTNALLEAVMKRIMPAHTVLHFVYGGNPGLLMFEDGEGFLMTEENDYLDLS